MSPNLQAAQDELKKHLIEDKVADGISNRPGKDDLLAHGIMKAGSVNFTLDVTTVAPALQSAQEALKNQMNQDQLSRNISQMKEGSAMGR